MRKTIKFVFLQKLYIQIFTAIILVDSVEKIKHYKVLNKVLKKIGVRCKTEKVILFTKSPLSEVNIK